VVVIERRLAQLFSYKLVFFANADSLDRIVKRLKPTEMARLLHTNKGLDGSRFVVKRERTFTVCNDLRQPLETLWKSFAPYNRAEIRKAERLVERVRITRNEPAGSDDFIAVYNDFARLKDGVWPISARLLNRYDGFADRLVLYLDEQPMVVNLVLRDGESGRVDVEAPIAAHVKGRDLIVFQQPVDRGRMHLQVSGHFTHGHNW
jgi:hypothetical protein